jgi:hypothetical protein
MNARTYIVLAYVAIPLGCLWAADTTPENRRSQMLFTLDRQAAYSSYEKTFAEGFSDPNIVIGVFEIPYRIDLLMKVFPGDPLELLKEYARASNDFGLVIARPVKILKGELKEPAVFFGTPTPGGTWAGGPVAPPLAPSADSKWILALDKVPSEKRTVLFREGIEKCSLINDRNLFMVRNFGYGSLCLNRLPKDKLPVREVPEATVDDLQAIQKVMPRLVQAKTDPNEAAAVSRTQKALKTDMAKAIFDQILTDRTRKDQDPNRTSR